ncbi:MAG TPA: bifunctional folylpolyglutamate synthase/dihydrofolate synthase, partial [bacterium]|nr:bifunctional folylpolyglutamate synthase/dihydrofolate synthase [bacterium]
MTFAEAEEYLSSLISYEKYGRAKYGQQTFSLTVFRHILERLGNPERQLRAIHVAGTDGKGSVCQYLTCILQQAGFSVGTYTSPHLQTVRERIQINRVPIDELDFANQVERVRPILDSLPDALPAETPEGERNPPSFFEALTAMAFLHFADKQVDYAVIEVGLGGRLDAT